MKRRDAGEVGVGREHRQLVPEAKLREEGVDRPDLRSFASARRAELRRGHVVVTVGYEQRERGEAAHDLLACAGTSESLEQLLEHEAGRDHLLAAFESRGERGDFREVGRPVAPKSERPDARVDEERQARERSDL